MRKHHKALDHVLMAMASFKAGKPVKAAKAMAAAIEDPGFDEALKDLNDEQEKNASATESDEEEIQEMKTAAAAVVASMKKPARARLLSRAVKVCAGLEDDADIDEVDLNDPYAVVDAIADNVEDPTDAEDVATVLARLNLIEISSEDTEYEADAEEDEEDEEDDEDGEEENASEEEEDEEDEEDDEEDDEEGDDADDADDAGLSKVTARFSAALKKRTRQASNNLKNL